MLAANENGVQTTPSSKKHDTWKQNVMVVSRTEKDQDTRVIRKSFHIRVPPWEYIIICNY